MKTYGANIFCRTCHAEPWPDSPTTRETFDLMHVGDRWFCEQHRPKEKRAANAVNDEGDDRGPAQSRTIMTGAALVRFQTDFAHARDDLEGVIADVVDLDVDDVLAEADDGATKVDEAELERLLSRLANASEACTGAFKDFERETRRAMEALQQELVRETAGGYAHGQT